MCVCNTALIVQSISFQVWIKNSQCAFNSKWTQRCPDMSVWWVCVCVCGVCMGVGGWVCMCVCVCSCIFRLHYWKKQWGNSAITLCSSFSCKCLHLCRKRTSWIDHTTAVIKITPLCTFRSYIKHAGCCCVNLVEKNVGVRTAAWTTTFVDVYMSSFKLIRNALKQQILDGKLVTYKVRSVLKLHLD